MNGGSDDGGDSGGSGGGGINVRNMYMQAHTHTHIAFPHIFIPSVLCVSYMGDAA